MSVRFDEMDYICFSWIARYSVTVCETDINTACSMARGREGEREGKTHVVGTKARGTLV